MKLLIAFVVAIIALATWDMLAYNGKYRQSVTRMVGHIASHVR